MYIVKCFKKKYFKDVSYDLLDIVGRSNIVFIGILSDFFNFWNDFIVLVVFGVENIRR